MSGATSVLLAAEGTLGFGIAIATAAATTAAFDGAATTAAGAAPVTTGAAATGAAATDAAGFIENAEYGLIENWISCGK